MIFCHHHTPAEGIIKPSARCLQFKLIIMPQRVRWWKTTSMQSRCISGIIWWKQILLLESCWWVSVQRLLSTLCQHPYSIWAKSVPAGRVQRETDNGFLCALSGPNATHWKPAVIPGTLSLFCHLQVTWSNNSPPPASITASLVGDSTLPNWIAKDL